MSSSHSLELSQFPGGTVVQLPEDLFDPLAILMIQQDLMEYAEQDRPQKLIVDFHNVTRCGSEAIGALIRLAHRVRSYGGDVKLCRMNDCVQEVFSVLKLLGHIFELTEHPNKSGAA